MPIVLFRVDERLIHGQVVIGWGHELRPERYVVVDDDLSESPWEQELYRLGAGSAEVVFSSAEGAADSLPGYSRDPVRTIVLTRDLATMRSLAESGHMEGRTVNVGGLHHGQGREQVLSYVHLAPGDPRRHAGHPGLRRSNPGPGPSGCPQGQPRRAVGPDAGW